MWSTTLEAVGEVTARSGGAYIVGSGTANTKGSYVELDASTAFTVAWFMAHYGHHAGFLSAETLFDISTGAAASEVVLIADFCYSYTLSHFPVNQAPLLFPVAIASGTRVAARCQISTTSVANALQMFLLLAEHASLTGSSVADTMGAVTGDSGGTSIDPGASANAKGAYTEMDASTANAYNWLVINIGNQGNTARTASNFLLDISTGAAASEVVLIPDVFFSISAGVDLPFASNWSIGVDEILAATRIAVRAQCEITDATDRLFDLILIGFNMAVPSGGGGGETSHVF